MPFVSFLYTSVLPYTSVLNNTTVLDVVFEFFEISNRLLPTPSEFPLLMAIVFLLNKPKENPLSCVCCLCSMFNRLRVLSGNRINGKIPKEIGNITVLNGLGLEVNKLDEPLPPELGNLAKMEILADVFSFGVVALEIVSGQSNAHSMPDEDFAFLLDWACVLQEKGRLLELVDPSLGTDEEEALRMLNIALLCTSPSPSLRPTLSSIVDMLEGRSPAIQAPTLSTTISKASLYTAYSFNDPYKYSTTGSSESLSGFHGRRSGLWAASSDSIANKEQEPHGISQSYIVEENTRLYHTM